MTSVPTMIAMILREKALLARGDLTTVTAVRMGSAPVSRGLLAAARRTFPNAVITNSYGTTEAGPIVFTAHPDGRPTPDLSVGVAHPNVSLRLADGTNSDASEGVLQMRCPALMNGYHNLPEVTAKALTADGFYVTGDVFRRDVDGFYYFYRPRRRHVRQRRRKHLPRRDRGDARAPSGHPPSGCRAGR
jgi:long-subunit acyl-CoA synthetase (AMP-forming)